MKRPVRELLADSRIAAIAIAFLLFSAIERGLRGLLPPLFDVIKYVLTAIAIQDLPYWSFGALYRFQLISTLTYLYVAVIEMIAAWALSRWVYGMAPIRSLQELRRATRRHNAEA